MEYIASREELPKTNSEIEAAIWCNLWKNRQWPYKDVEPGDIVYWYDRTSAAIVWKTRIEDVERFAYDSKEEALRRVEARFGRIDRTDPYFHGKPDSGYCMAYKVRPIERLFIKKPDSLSSFPQLGWRRTDDQVAAEWLK